MGDHELLVIPGERSEGRESRATACVRESPPRPCGPPGMTEGYLASSLNPSRISVFASASSPACLIAAATAAEAWTWG